MYVKWDGTTYQGGGEIKLYASIVLTEKEYDKILGKNKKIEKFEEKLAKEILKSFWRQLR